MLVQYFDSFFSPIAIGILEFYRKCQPLKHEGLCILCNHIPYTLAGFVGSEPGIVEMGHPLFTMYLLVELCAWETFQRVFCNNDCVTCTDHLGPLWWPYNGYATTLTHLWELLRFCITAAYFDSSCSSYVHKADAKKKSAFSSESTSICWNFTFCYASVNTYSFEVNYIIR